MRTRAGFCCCAIACLGQQRPSSIYMSGTIDSEHWCIRFLSFDTYLLDRVALQLLLLGGVSPFVSPLPNPQELRHAAAVGLQARVRAWIGLEQCAVWGEVMRQRMRDRDLSSQRIQASAAYSKMTHYINDACIRWVWEREANINWPMMTCQGSTRSELP